MGYQLSSIFSISPDDKHSYFIFLIGDGFKTTVTKSLHENFTEIAKELGPKAVIVRGLSSDFHEEVIGVYHIEISNQFTSLLNGYRKKFGIEFSHQSFLIITDKNPNSVSESEDGIFYLIPLNLFTSDNEVAEALSIIYSCINSDDFSVLERFLRDKSGIWQTNVWQVANEALELKPNIAGLGINLNKIIEWITIRRK